MDDFSKMLKQLSKQIQQTGEQVIKDLQPTIKLVGDNLKLAVEYAADVTEEVLRDSTEFVKKQTENVRKQASNAVTLEEIGQKLGDWGLPAMAFAIAVAEVGTVGYAGGAVVAAALALLGGPFGVIGGLASLGVLTLIASAVSEHGIEAILIAGIRAWRAKGKSDEDLFGELNQWPIGDSLKAKIAERLRIAMSDA
jgi:ElaB/YqjD/DUF883 family membrane-anchored ribosome-binding protein